MLSRRATAIYKFFFMSYAPLPDVFTIYNDKNDLDERAAVCLTLKKMIL
jgi:hypothetical protein